MTLRIKIQGHIYTLVPLHMLIKNLSHSLFIRNHNILNYFYFFQLTNIF